MEKFKKSQLWDNAEQHKLVRAYVKHFIINYPIQYRDNQKIVKWKRDTNTTKWAETKNSDVVERQILEIPTLLYQAVIERLPDWFQDNKNLNWFTKSFPQFDVANKI